MVSVLVHRETTYGEPALGLKSKSLVEEAQLYAVCMQELATQAQKHACRPAARSARAGTSARAARRCAYTRAR